MGRNLTNLPISASFQYLVQKSGSVFTDGTGSLIELVNISASHANFSDTSTSASFSDTSTSASFSDFATTASFALNVIPIDTGSLLTTASYLNPNLTFTKGDGSTFDVTIDTTVETGSLMETGSVTDATLTFTKADGSTFPLTVNNVANATSATIALSASHAVNADNAVTAQTASFLPADTNLNINSITASNASFTSASIGYLQTVSGSATIIGDAFIILNNDTPTQRYAGLKVYDSGSANVTASLQWDGLTHDWKYEYSASATHEGGVLLTGPEGTDLATLPYPANNAIQKGTGTHHLASSSMTDDGTLVTINANVSASGYVSASSFVGDGSGLTGITTGGLVSGSGTDSMKSADALTTNPSTASGTRAIAIGDNTQATGTNAIAIGQNAAASNSSTAIGDNSSAGVVAAALGRLAGADGYGTVAVGQQANSSANYGVSVGFQAVSDTDSGLAIGRGANATGSLAFDLRFNNATAMSGTTSNQDITFAANVTASAFSGDGSGLDGVGKLLFSGSTYYATDSGTVDATTGVVIGNASTSTSDNVVVVGSNSAGNGNSAVVVGVNASAEASAVAIGRLASSQNSGVSMGQSAVADDGVAIGRNAKVASGVAIGYFASSSASNNIAIGNSALATGSIDLNIGNIIVNNTSTNVLTLDAPTTAVSALTTDGQVTGNVGAISIASSTGSMDCSAGNFFAITLANGVDTHLDVTNITAGQTINLRVTNNAITAGTISFAPEFKFADGTAFEVTSNTSAVDVMTFIAFDGTSLLATGLKNFS